MASNRITDIIQMPNGEIWIATQDGVSRFDGMYWSTFPDSLPIPYGVGKVRMELLADSSLIMASSNSDGFRLSLFQRGSWSAIQPPAAISEATSFNFQMMKGVGGKPSYPAFSFGRQVYFLINGVWQSISLPGSSEKYAVTLLQYRDKILVATRDEVYRITDGKKVSKLYSHPDIRKMTMSADGQYIYLLHERAISQISADGSQHQYIIQNEPLGNYATVGQTCLFLFQDQLYYSLNSPLTQVNLKTGDRKQILTDYYTADHTCMSAMVDSEGSIWVATLRGAFRVKDLSILNYDKEVLIEDEVTAIYEDANGDRYLGSNVGLSVLTKNGNVTHYPFNNVAIKNRIMDIIKHDEEIYLSVSYEGIMKFNGDGLELVPSSKQLIGASDLHSFDGELYCSAGPVMYRRVDNDWTVALDLRPIKEAMIRKILIDDIHQLLLTDAGVISLIDSTVIQSADLYKNNVYSAINFQNQLYLGTAAGISRIENEQIIESGYSVESPVYALSSPNDRDLWVGTGSGMLCFTPQNTYQYTKNNGLVGNEINRNAFLFAEDGSLLVGTDEGMSVIDPTHKRKAPVPNIEIVGIEANQKPIDQYDLSFQINSLKFSFRSTSYYNIEELSYRVRLLGLNEDWEYIPFAEQNTVSYPNLSPGAYQFEVQAHIGNGEWSKVARSPKVHIEAAFYEQVWFRIVFVIFIVSSLVYIYRFRSRLLKERNEELENRVLEKTQELEHRNRELIHTIEDLKAAQGQLIQSEKLASMGHLTSGIAHELNNPLNYIRGGAECIMRNLEELTVLLNGWKKRPANMEMIMEESRMLAESILEGANKSTGIVKSLGSFTADSQNFYSFTDLQKEVETSLTLLNNEIGFRIIINKMFGNIPPIECYPAKINQMLVNILLNSIQSIKDRGEITIRYYRKDDQRIALEISDDGEGVPTHLHEKVFEPFFTTKDSNPGLGLTIAKSIVQEHKGTIVFISKPGLGTKVKIQLPVSQTYHPELEEE